MSADSRPPPKKTEMIEVRVSHETKRDFLAACRREGRTASDVVRDALDAFISAQPAAPSPAPAAPSARPLLVLVPKALRRKRYLAIAAATASLTLLAALPSAAQSRSPPSCSLFQRLDANHDGKLTYAEYAAP